MKKTLLLTAIAAMPLLSNAQKLEKPIIDKFSGDTTQFTNENTLTNKFDLIVNYLSCRAMKVNTLYEIGFHILKGSTGYYAIHKGDKCYIKFDNGDIITLFSSDDYSSNTRYSSYGSSYESTPWFVLKQDDIDKLKNGKVTTIRIVTTVAPFDYDIKDKNSEIIKKELSLFKI